MYKFLIVFCIFIIITGCTNVKQNIEDSNIEPSMQVPSPVVNKEISSDLNCIMKTISSISSYKRPIGSQGEKDACQYLKKEFERYGYLTLLQTFPYDLQRRFVSNSTDDDFWNLEVTEQEKDGESQNLIAYKNPGKGTDNNIIIISAHYDTTGSYGIIDNATGVAVLMETARMIADLRLNAEIRFVLFSGEEDGIIGSRYYVNELSDEEKAKIHSNINLDYIGEASENNLILATIDGNENAASGLFTNSPGGNKLEVVKAPVSDYISFARAGIPAVSLGQLPVAWEMNDYTYTSEQEWERISREFEMKRLDEERLKNATDMVVNMLLQFVV